MELRCLGESAESGAILREGFDNNVDLIFYYFSKLENTFDKLSLYTTEDVAELLCSYGERCYYQIDDMYGKLDLSDEFLFARISLDELDEEEDLDYDFNNTVDARDYMIDICWSSNGNIVASTEVSCTEGQLEKLNACLKEASKYLFPKIKTPIPQLAIKFLFESWG